MIQIRVSQRSFWFPKQRFLATLVSDSNPHQFGSAGRKVPCALISETRELMRIKFPFYLLRLRNLKDVWTCAARGFIFMLTSTFLREKPFVIFSIFQIQGRRKPAKCHLRMFRGNFHACYRFAHRFFGSYGASGRQNNGGNAIADYDLRIYERFVRCVS